MQFSFGGGRYIVYSHTILVSEACRIDISCRVEIILQGVCFFCRGGAGFGGGVEIILQGCAFSAGGGGGGQVYDVLHGTPLVYR